MIQLERKAVPQSSFWTDAEGSPRKYELYQGKPKDVVNNYDKYSDPDFSDRRREEIKRMLGAKNIVTSFKREIRAQIRLTKNLKKS